jgi:hypothetical protein
VVAVEDVTRDAVLAAEDVMKNVVVIDAQVLEVILATEANVEVVVILNQDVLVAILNQVVMRLTDQLDVLVQMLVQVFQNQDVLEDSLNFFVNFKSK